MSSTATSWSVQGNSKAGGTVTTTDAFTTGTLTADTLTLSSNKITFGNSEIIDNLTDEVIAFRASGSDDKMILGVVSGGAGEDCGLLLYEGTTVRWSMQHDASDDTDFALVWDYGNVTAGGATKMKLASDGDLTIAGDLTATGNTIYGSSSSHQISLTSNGLTVGMGYLILGSVSNRGHILLDNGSATDTPGYIAFTTPDGDIRTLWIDNDGKVRTSNLTPSDSGGTIVGTQSA